LPQEILLEVHAAVVRAGLAHSREVLLLGIDPHLVASLPSAPNPAAQILSDLSALNEIGQLTDGTIPLQIWLMNAEALTGPRREGEVFRRALAAIDG
jgi:hypothetical protein